MTERRIETRTVHVPLIEARESKPIGMPIYQGHLFSFDTADEMAAAFEGPAAAPFYGRLGNPTVRSFEAAMADLEGGVGALATGSGMGAINAVLHALLRTGDHVIAQSCLYGGTYGSFQTLVERWGIEITYVSGTCADEVRDAMRPNTRLLYLETIANPTTQVVDIPAMVEAAGPEVKVVVDNTFATPLLCRPLEHGADVVVHSATKFICGHGDVLAGVAVFASAELHRTVWEEAIELGASLDPFAAYLLLRGLQTLALRMPRHCENAVFLAKALEAHPAVSTVRYPSLPGHPDYDVAQRLLSGGGGVLSFDLVDGREAGRRFIESVKLAALTASLGSSQTLVIHPASTSHRMYSAEALAAAGFTEGTVRIAVGLEHPDDIWDDFRQAL